MEYLIRDMEKKRFDQRQSNLYIYCQYKSIESVNWLLVLDITTVEKLKKGRQGIPSKIFDTRETDKFGATCHFEKR